MWSNWRAAGAFLLAVTSGGAMADSLDINLNEETVRVTYGTNPAGKRGLEVDFGHYFGESDSSITHVGLHVSGENWSKRGVFDIGLGGRFVFAHTEPFDEGAFAFGARVRFSPVQRVGFGGSVYYAPAVTTFLDGENYREASLSLDYQVLPQGFVYVGYRTIEVDFDGAKDVEFDDRAHVGMKLLF
jgi:hypothetical protein